MTGEKIKVEAAMDAADRAVKAMEPLIQKRIAEAVATENMRCATAARMAMTRGKWFDELSCSLISELIQKSDASTLPGAVPLSMRVARALEVARRFGDIDGAHHNTWVIDQMVRALCGCDVQIQHDPGEQDFTTWMEMASTSNAEYEAWVIEYRASEGGPDTYRLNEWIAP